MLCHWRGGPRGVGCPVYTGLGAFLAGVGSKAPMFTSSIPEVMQPLGRIFRQNWSPVVLSTRLFWAELGASLIQIAKSLIPI